jgi:CheY-like chemotaxis protein/DNA-directed RNA polymerase specialized sigma24 family protein
MSLGEKIRHYLPFLRRYARALTGSTRQGDAIVRMTLETIVAAPDEFEGPHPTRVLLYRYFHRILESVYLPDLVFEEDDDGLAREAQSRLSRTTPLGRQILLLNTLEGFSLSETSVIVDLDRREVADMLREAISEVDREARTSVLIIEDEPLIAMELEHIVTSLGHHVAAVATTMENAVAAFAQHDAGLVLADVQLADGSSGIDAVHDILQIAPVPVIFITAYPERLLTGSRTEPSFLIAKPFHEDAVRAAVSQCLYFDTELAA